MGKKTPDLETLASIPPWEWVKGSDKVVLDVLCDADAEEGDRVLAAELAGEHCVMNDAFADALIAILHNPNEPDALRGTAAIAFGPVLEEADMADPEFPDDLEELPIRLGTVKDVRRLFRKLYSDSSVPKEVRRRVLEASVCAPEDWHAAAIRAAYASDDPEWQLTAVFGMRHIRGFDDSILEALHSGDPQIHYEAVCAAGDREIAAAWPHVAGILSSEDRDKDLLLAAIEASVTIQPQEAPGLLLDLMYDADEDVVDAVHEAMAMAELMSAEFYGGEEEGEEEL